jgi:uncharacterized protein
MSTMALVLLSLQILLGALDNFLHHEFTERLPSRVSARRELALHAARESIYAVLFLVFAWTEPGGLFAVGVLGLLVCEIVITIADFIEEDRTRHLPSFERVLHTVLALLYGGFLIAVVPWLLALSAGATGVTFVSYGLVSWFFTVASIGVFAFAFRNGIAVRNLGRMRVRIPVVPSSGRTVLITGGTGFIGAAVVERLCARGDRVIVWVRDARQSRAVFGTRVLHVESLAHLPKEVLVDAVVNLAGAPVLGLPWTAARRRVIVRSRVDLTDRLVDWMRERDLPPRVLVSGSAIGFYGDRGDEVLDENAPAGSGFAADLCRTWEAAAFRARAFGVRVACLRIGLVLDRSGGALPMMALPVRLAAGALLGRGHHWMSWITRDDLVRMIVTAIDSDGWSGAINAVAPEPVRHADFQKALARTLKRPLFLSVPAEGLKLALGEMSSVLLYSQRVVPDKVLRLGFGFDVCWAADALMLQLAPGANEFTGMKERLQSDAAIGETGSKDPLSNGALDDHHDLRRATVPLRAQGAGGAGREEARV